MRIDYVRIVTASNHTIHCSLHTGRQQERGYAHSNLGQNQISRVFDHNAKSRLTQRRTCERGIMTEP